ncbi:MAG: winged helix-turn-helix transcriptional regulator [Chlorobium sp.]|nr:MAG: winged helix-turn-helix transcriptional regulator [Chlorobium sp.]
MDKTITITTEEVTKWNLILPDEMLEAVSNRFKLLSEPMRLKILRSLCERERTVQDIVNTINANQANVSKHLALMHDNGMVTRRKEGLKCYYRIADDSTVFACYLTSKSVVENLQHRLDQIQNFKSNLPNETSAATH